MEKIPTLLTCRCDHFYHYQQCSLIIVAGISLVQRCSQLFVICFQGLWLTYLTTSILFLSASLALESMSWLAFSVAVLFCRWRHCGTEMYPITVIKLVIECPVLTIAILKAYCYCSNLCVPPFLNNEFFHG